MTRAANIPYRDDAAPVVVAIGDGPALPQPMGKGFHALAFIGVGVAVLLEVFALGYLRRLTGATALELVVALNVRGLGFLVLGAMGGWAAGAAVARALHDRIRPPRRGRESTITRVGHALVVETHHQTRTFRREDAHLERHLLAPGCLVLGDREHDGLVIACGDEHPVFPQGAPHVPFSRYVSRIDFTVEGPVFSKVVALLEA